MTTARRKLRSRLASALAACCFVLLVAPFVVAVVRVAMGASFSRAVLAGCGRALVGSLEIVSLAALFGVPIGILAGVYAAEIAGPRLARTLRFFNEVLAGVPPIVLGLFVYATVVLPMGGLSALAGSVALMLVIVPIVARATEELVLLVPDDLRDASLGLGVPRYRVLVWVLLRSVLPGLANAIAYALSRAMGEAAALLFTSASSRWLSASLPSPTSSLSVEIFVSSQSQGAEARAAACTMTLTLLGAVGVLSYLGRASMRRGA